MLFRVLVVAQGFEPQFVTKVDPFAGPVEVVLEKFDRTWQGPGRQLMGRIIDPTGKPLVGATVSPYAITRGRSTRYGGPRDMDPLAITDEDGQFLIRAKEAFDAMYVEVEARGYAGLKMTSLNPNKGHLLMMTEGAALTGTVMADGKPLKGVTIGISGAERSVEIYAGHFEMGTSETGRFTLLNLPPNTDFWVYGTMDSLRNHGVIPIQRIRTGTNSSSIDIGKLELASGKRVSGRVVLTDGKPIPPNTKLFVGRDEAWDSLSIDLPPTGVFELTNIPIESINIGTRIEGYRFSPRNPNLDQLNQGSVVGRLTGDLINFHILMEPGPRLNRDDETIPWASSDRQPRNSPFRSVAPKDLPALPGGPVQ